MYASAQLRQLLHQPDRRVEILPLIARHPQDEVHIRQEARLDGDAHGAGTIGVWAPQIWDHVLAHDACKFSRLTVGGVTLATAFSRWLDGQSVRLIDGYRGSVTGTECGLTAPICP